MNTIRTPRDPHNAERQGLCRAGEVAKLLLAMYGIHDDPPANPPTQAFSSGKLVPANQQTFPWFGTVETLA